MKIYCAHISADIFDIPEHESMYYNSQGRGNEERMIGPRKETSMKTLRVFIATALIVCLASAAPVFAKSKTTHKNLEGLKCKTLSMTTVKVRWKKVPGVKKYVIYKRYWKGEKEKCKKLKTVSGKKKSAVLKLGKNKEIEILVKGVKKKKHGKKIVYEDTAYACSGLSRPEWYAEEIGGYYHSPTEIGFSFEPWDGLKPTGYEVYRKEVGAQKYTLIKKVNLKKAHLKYSFGWTDTSVKAGQRYYYKVRSYRKSGKKVYKSKMSTPGCLGATYYNGRFKVQKEADGEIMILKLTSDPLNEETGGGIEYGEGFPAKTENVCYMADACSYDGKVWRTMDAMHDGGFRVKAGESVWIRLKRVEDAKQYRDFIEHEQPVGGIYISCDYDGYDDAFMWINAYEDSAICYQ